jgi:hypothetical protein
MISASSACVLARPLPSTWLSNRSAPALRILAAEHGGVRERRARLTHPPYAAPELLAERPNEVWSWDISKLKGLAKLTYFYLYVILDVFSRYAVGWTVQHRESGSAGQGPLARHPRATLRLRPASVADQQLVLRWTRCATAVGATSGEARPRLRKRRPGAWTAGLRCVSGYEELRLGIVQRSPAAAVAHEVEHVAVPLGASVEPVAVNDPGTHRGGGPGRGR